VFLVNSLKKIKNKNLKKLVKLPNPPHSSSIDTRPCAVTTTREVLYLTISKAFNMR